MNDTIGTAGIGTTTDEALEAYTAFRHILDEQTPRNKVQAGRIDKTSAPAHDAGTGSSSSSWTRPSRTGPVPSPTSERTIPAERVTQAVALLDIEAATNPNTHTNVLALQATLLWLDGRNGQAQQRAVRALQDDPWNRMAQLMLKAISAKVSPRWVH